MDEGFEDQSDEMRAGEFPSIDFIEMAYLIMSTLPSHLILQLSQRIQPLLKRDFITQLPKELAIYILSLTDHQTMAKAATVSHGWNTIANDSSCWRALFIRQHWRIRPIRPFKPILSEHYDQKDSQSMSMSEEVADGYFSLPRDMSELSSSYSSLVLGEESLLDTSSTASLRRFASKKIAGLLNKQLPPIPQDNNLDWKNIYKERLKLEENWKNGNYIQKELIGHTDAVYTLQCDGHLLISGSKDHTIKAWDIEQGSCLATLQGHNASVLCLQFDDSYIVTGSSDATMILWDLCTGTMIRRLYGHVESVLNLRFDKSKIVSCSKDKTIKIWDIRTGLEIKTLIGHRAAVNAVQFMDGIVVSGSGDRTIRMWSMSSGKMIRELQGHARGIATVQYDGNIILSGSSGNFDFDSFH
jgi:WD40 repeat protein